MSLEDLNFELTSTGATIYDPVTLSSTVPITFTIRNLGIEDITDIGIYIVPATTLGDVDYPADYPPETDYQDLMTWGEQTTHGLALAGGLKLTVTNRDGDTATYYITRQQGSTLMTKINLADIPVNTSQDVVMEIETPPSVSARRMYISLKIDQDL